MCAHTTHFFPNGAACQFAGLALRISGFVSVPCPTPGTVRHEARFVVTIDYLPLGPRQAIPLGYGYRIDHLGDYVPSACYLLGGLLSRVGRFVRRIDLCCTEDSINHGIFSVLVGAYRGKVKKICTDTNGLSDPLLKRLVRTLRQQGLTGLEELDLLVAPAAGDDDVSTSTLAAAALQYCPNLTKVNLEMEGNDDDSKPFDFLPLAQALRLRGGVDGKAQP